MTLNETTLFKVVLRLPLSVVGPEAPVPLLYQTLHPSLSMPEPLLRAAFF